MKIIRKVGKTKHNIKDLMTQIEQIIFNCSIAEYPDNWDQKYITQSLLLGLKGYLDNKTFHLPGDIINTQVKTYALYEFPQEQKLSQLGILFNISYHDGTAIEGGTLLDSHLKDSNKNTFSTIRKDVLKRSTSLSHHSSVLLFDYDSINGMAFPALPETILGNYPHSWTNWQPFTNLVAIRSNLVHALNIKHTGLYKVAVPFSYQLSYRYLYGLDLDFTENTLNIIKGHKEDKGNPNYIVCVSVSHGKSIHTRFDINQELYHELE